MSKENEIVDLLRPLVEEHGLYLEGVKLNRAGKHSALVVTIDLPEGPGGVGSDALSSVTRAISGALDEADPIAGSYNLEVTTPGAERELTEPRHFSRAQGRLVAFVFDDGAMASGRIEELQGDSVMVSVDGQRREISLDSVSKAHVQIEF
ncbi:ribosome maturation factor RimP [Trueperella bonasi]|uniref:Ribosome maturation factor RimP n=1 Tax=Trueperella bonasi TaxID=312286 RepID=A0ABT9NHT7_9ACTO|nr:ribosome maturation factor RimP [Trueperella bonasi]MDP9806961.1 ribosome maturation factor RimP [Trueperella bonasi]